MPANILDRLKILIVDDVASMRQVMSVILSKYGCKDIRAEATADAGLAAAHEERFDVALVDYMLGDKTGAQLVWKLRSLRDCVNRDLPILVLTGKTETEIITEIRAAGADAFLLKPVPPDRLARRVLELSRRERTAPRPIQPRKIANGAPESGPVSGTENEPDSTAAPASSPGADAADDDGDDALRI